MCARWCFVSRQFRSFDCFVTHTDCLCRTWSFTCLRSLFDSFLRYCSPLVYSQCYLLPIIMSFFPALCLLILPFRSAHIRITRRWEKRSQNGKYTSVLPLSIYVPIIYISCTSGRSLLFFGEHEVDISLLSGLVYPLQLLIEFLVSISPSGLS